MRRWKHRICGLALPSPRSLSRFAPAHHIKNACARFDDFLQEALSNLAGSPVSDWAWLKASLPSSRGGLNLRRACLHAPAAYIGSLDQSRVLVSRILGHTPPSFHQATSVGLLAEAAGRQDWTSLDELDVPHRQRPLSHSINDCCFQLLLQSAPDMCSTTLAHSSLFPHAGDWLNAIPSSALGIHIPDRDFRLCLVYWLGLRMVGEDDSPCPVCQGRADGYGDHQVGCGGNGDRIHRHDSIRDALFSTAQSAALAPWREAPLLIPGSSSRPADVYLPNWMRGQPAALDMTVISPMQQLTIAGAARSPGYVLKVGEDRKMAAHVEECHSAGILFTPLVVEALGGWCEGATHTIRRIGRLQGQRLGIEPAKSTRHLFQHLSVTQWRGNATLWTQR